MDTVKMHHGASRRATVLVANDYMNARKVSRDARPRTLLLGLVPRPRAVRTRHVLGVRNIAEVTRGRLVLARQRILSNDKYSADNESARANDRNTHENATACSSASLRVRPGGHRSVIRHHDSTRACHT